MTSTGRAARMRAADRRWERACQAVRFVWVAVSFHWPWAWATSGESWSARRYSFWNFGDLVVCVLVVEVSSVQS